MPVRTTTINETTTPSNDWPQWRNIPFLDGNPAGSASGSAMTSIKRVYVSNDSTNLYVRVDNASGSLSAYNTSPDFAISDLRPGLQPLGLAPYDLDRVLQEEHLIIR